MADPIPPTNTARLFVDYADGDTRHTVILRPQTGVTVAQLATWFNDFLTDNAGLFLTRVSFDGAREALINSNVTNPIAWTTVAGTNPSSPKTDGKPWFLSFVGRSAQGHRTRMSIYGAAYGDDSNYRITAAENAGVADAVTQLNDLQAKLGDITGSKAVWKDYINLGYNAYWQRQARRG